MARNARLLFVAAALLAGCRESPDSLSTGPQVLGATRVSQFPRITTHDDMLAAVAARESAFAGMYLQDGVLRVMLTNVSREPAIVRDAIRSVFADPRVADRPITVHHARYNFAQLREWGRSLPLVFSLPGISFTDIDETQNKLVVGVVAESQRAAVVAFLTGRGVPEDAISVVQRERAQLLQTGTSLGGVVRMIIGGVHTDLPVSPNFCTIGFNTIISGSPSFATNGHCSNSWGTPNDGTNYWQAFRTVPAQFIGVKGVESQVFSSSLDPNCPSSGPECKWSDFSVGTYTSGMISQQAYGYFARTTTRTQFDSNLVINQSNPVIPIVSKSLWPLVGQNVDKIGARTGWTSGPVTQSCVTEEVDPPGPQRFFFVCAFRASLGSGFGDSGSGIFIYNTGSGQATLTGQLFGGTGFNGSVFTITLFSPLNNIQAEFGLVPATIYGN